MTTTRPTPTARLLLNLALRHLALQDQVRYREELTADMCDLARNRQARYALSALRGSFALRRALARPDPDEADVAVISNWRCQLRSHRYVARSDPNRPPDGTARPVYYLECSRCGRYSTVSARRRNYLLASVVALVALWVFAPTMVAILLSLGIGAGVAATYEGDTMQMALHGPGHQFRQPPPK
jgi:hypothetical protein